ncbi:uncharacterized protein LOC115787874 [Archocentrus centrarchus]|uniref:uncharacterized protein LOC115787874 n=1 Tax=Archocentrus centrarchus TaxID=63155 RepID=UPI0011E9C358|nr:uncharacterized protein LOC115787874 [Archocentrus centrarchus]
MMEFLHVAVAVFSLLSLGRSVPVTSCENLIQSREIHGNQLLGKWTLIGESTNMTEAKMLTKMFVDSAWVNVTAADRTDTFNSLHSQKMLGICFAVKISMTLANNTLTVESPYQASSVLLNTGCPDCLVIYSNTSYGSLTFKGLQLLSRRVKVSAAELAEFRKQAECLNLPSPAILDSEKGFCPDPALTPETMTIDLTSSLGSLNSGDFSQIEKLFRDNDGIKTLSDSIQSILDQMKQQAN